MRVGGDAAGARVYTDSARLWSRRYSRLDDRSSVSSWPCGGKRELLAAAPAVGAACAAARRAAWLAAAGCSAVSARQLRLRSASSVNCAVAACGGDVRGWDRCPVSRSRRRRGSASARGGAASLDGRDAGAAGAAAARRQTQRSAARSRTTAVSACRHPNAIGCMPHQRHALDTALDVAMIICQAETRLRRTPRTCPKAADEPGKAEGRCDSAGRRASTSSRIPKRFALQSRAHGRAGRARRRRAWVEPRESGEVATRVAEPMTDMVKTLLEGHRILAVRPAARARGADAAVRRLPGRVDATPSAHGRRRAGAPTP